MNQYKQAFIDNDVDCELLCRLTSDDLKDIGVASLGHRRRLLDAIASLNSTPHDAPVSSAPALAIASRQPDAERRQLTVMFIDLVGSTALSAKLDPEDMREIIRLYQNTVAGEITRFEGHVAKFMGDGVLAYFGWPKAHEDEAERAVRAGLAVVKAMDRLQTPAKQTLEARIGIATGLVVVGDLVGELCHHRNTIAHAHIGQCFDERHEARLHHAATFRRRDALGAGASGTVASALALPAPSRSVFTCAKVRLSPSKMASRPVSACQRSIATSM
jgi:class 3 adenylate cyclase